MNSKGFKIAIFIPSLRGGGAERVMVTLANEFSERGYIVDLLLASATGAYLSEVSPNVQIIDFRKPRVSACLFPLIKYLRKKKPASLLSAMTHANVIALLVAMIARVETKVVVSERNDFSVKNLDEKSSLEAKIITFLSSYLYKSAGGIHAVSEGVASSTAKRLGLDRSQITVIYNPTVTQKLLDLSDEMVDYSWLENMTTPFIVAAGRLTKQKDFATLIRAFALVRVRIESKLVIMGEGELRSELEHQIKELGLEGEVFLPGFVENPFAVFRRASLFVLSSAWEGLPNVLIQAMACGTPVVSTDCPSGPAEILENGKWGRLVPVGDVEELAKAILNTLTETEHTDVAARAAYFSVKRAADEYLRLLFPDLNQ